MRVAAGAVARKVIAGVTVRGALVQVGPHKIDRRRWDWAEVERNPFFCPDHGTVQTWAGFLDEVRLHSLGDEQRVAALSLIDENGERYVRMAHLACVGSHAVNGVADLHTELLKRNVLGEFYRLWPRRFLRAAATVS